MFALERQKIILQKLADNGAVWVSRLSSELGVTEETIRRDLEKLEKQECLMRTHGGAVPIDATAYELSLEKRKRTNVDAKEKLAAVAAGYILPGDTVFLDASTTTFYMAKEINNIKNITVITNSIRVVNELAGSENIKLIAVGGIASHNMSLVGTLAEDNISKNYFADKMFFSSKGIMEETGILESNEQECGIKKCMLKNSKSAYYLCDKSKIGRVGFAKLARFEDIECLITDATISESWENVLKESKVELVKV